MENIKYHKTYTPFRWLLTVIYPRISWVLITVASALISSMLGIALAYLMEKIVNLSLTGKSDELIGFAIMLLFSILLGVLCKYMMNYSSKRVSAYAMFDIRKTLFQHIEKLSPSFVDNQQTADIVSRITNDANSVEKFLSNKFLVLVSQPTAFVLMYIYMIFVNWKLLLFSTVIVPIIMVINLVVLKSIKQSMYQLQKFIGDSNSLTQEVINGIAVIKSFNLKDKFFARYRNIIDTTVSKNLGIYLRIAVMQSLSYILRVAPSILCVILGGYLIINKQMTPGDLVAFIYLLNILIEALVDIPDALGEFKMMLGSAARLNEVVSYPVEYGKETVSTIDLSKPPIAFKNVTFGYDEKSTVLKNLSFTVEKGKTVALVGQSGCGKSTIFKLSCGFYKPMSGCVEIYGHELNGNSLEICRRQIALVTQDTYLFPFSIAQNIAYGKPGAAMEDVIAAAKAAFAHDFIMSLPQGYDTIVGERGERLSGGQKQRISIARAVLKNAPILLMDEATSALDKQSEAGVQEAMKHLKKDRTILIIAHRLSTIASADEILVIHEGNIVERGTHNDLINTGIFYNKLYINQPSAMV